VARYVEVAETGGRLGFITPMTPFFELQSCALHMHALYLFSARKTLPIYARRCALPKATNCFQTQSTKRSACKPKGHDFVIDRRTKRPAVSRHMSVTGG
jgi:cyclic pyranopterin phosphate synthase